VITCFNYIRAMLNPEIRCIFEKSMASGVNFRYLIYYNNREEKIEALRLNKKYFLQIGDILQRFCSEGIRIFSPDKDLCPLADECISDLLLKYRNQTAGHRS